MFIVEFGLQKIKVLPKMGLEKFTVVYCSACVIHGGICKHSFGVSCCEFSLQQSDLDFGVEVQSLSSVSEPNHKTYVFLF